MSGWPGTILTTMLADHQRRLSLAAVLVLTTLCLGPTSSPEPVAAQETDHQIQGLVLGPDHEPLEGIEVLASGYPEGRGFGVWLGSTTDSVGAFTIAVPDGYYLLKLFVTLEDVECTLGWVGADGSPTLRPSWDRRVTVSGTDISAITIILPGTPSELCRRIQGVLLDPDGEPVDGAEVRAWGAVAGFGGLSATDSEGAFTLAVPKGAFLLQFVVYREGSECSLVWAGSDRIPRFQPPWDLQFAVSDSDLADVVVRLPGTVSNLCKRIDGVVTDEDGEPLPSLSVWVSGQGPVLGRGRLETTSSDGTFAMYAAPGPYALRVRTSGGSTCTVVGYPDAEPGMRASVTVGDYGVSGIRIVISVDPTSGSGSTTCYFAPEAATTELQPGYNLIGWTTAGRPVRDIFEEIPELEAVHAWDPKAQQFRAALRAASGVEGDLDAVAPGMGLWLSVGGEEPVSWTRPLSLTDARAHLVSLKPGWNLVAWSGREKVTTQSALAGLDPAFGEVWLWNAEDGHYIPVGTSTPPGLPGTPWRLGHGDALWVYSPSARFWLQPDWPLPDLRFLGDYTPDYQDRRRADIAEIQLFYAQRYGVITSDVTFYFSPDREALTGPYRTLKGTGDGWCATARPREIVILTSRCLAIAHEYFHVIQFALSGDDKLKGTPIWLHEGSALYTDFQHRYARATHSYEEDYRDAWLELDTPLDGDFDEYFEPSQRIWMAFTFGYNVMEWLRDNTGETTIIDYFAALSTSDSWTEAFRTAFDMTEDEFYTRFEEYRLSIAPPFE